jgi:acetyl-CoA C-acetyltransferase
MVVNKVAIIGTGLTKTATKRREVTHPDITYEAVTAALTDAGITLNEVDAVVYGCMDPFDGVEAPDRWDADSTGAPLGKPYMKISTGGTTGGSAAQAGYYHAASGLFDVVLVVCCQRVGECEDAQLVLNTAVDPVYERETGAGAITVAALQGAAHIAKYGTKMEHFAMVAAKNHENAFNNPNAHLHLHMTVKDVMNSGVISWPLTLYMCCPRSDGAVAVIFASEKKAKQLCKEPAWVKGAGSISDTYTMGERPDFADWDSLEILGRRVYRKAKITDPMKDFQVAELYEAFACQEILEYEALHLCGKGEGGKLVESGVTGMKGALPVDPSGGVQATNPIGATGLIRVAEAARQVMGRAGQMQVPNVETALAHAWGGAISLHTMMILGRTP